MVLSVVIILIFLTNYLQNVLKFDFQPWSSLWIFCGRHGWEQLPKCGKPKLSCALSEEESERRPDPRVLPISYEACAPQERKNELSNWLRWNVPKTLILWKDKFLIHGKWQSAIYIWYEIKMKLLSFNNLYIFKMGIQTFLDAILFSNIR